MEAKLLNQIHPEIDQFMERFLAERFLPSADYRTKFKPYKRNKRKQYHQAVLPVVFGINRFYRKPLNYNWNQWHLHDMMWRQQQMNLNHIQPPGVPGRF